jgi:hypothetical protein
MAMAAAAAAAAGARARGGAVPFCAECHAILDLPDENPIVCRICKYETTFQGRRGEERVSAGQKAVTCQET